jgi:hypothetical protein
MWDECASLLERPAGGCDIVPQLSAYRSTQPSALTQSASFQALLAPSIGNKYSPMLA